MMIPHNAVTLLITLLVLSMTDCAWSAVQLYTGRMEILITSGKACEGLTGSYDVSLAFEEAGEGGGIRQGYFVGEGITIGRFSGSEPTRLDVRYPFHDELRASGHTLTLTRSAAGLTAELHDRHVDAAADDCNFDHAHMELSRSVDADATARLERMAGQFDAQMNRSQALAQLQVGGYAAALPYFEKALVLADTFLGGDSDQINSYIIGLATTYIWLERFDEFNRLFDTRIIQLKDESVRSIFSGYRVRTLLNEGKGLFGREEFDSALKIFEQANKLQPQNREVIAAVMSVHIRSGHYAEAISFLEQSESVLSSELDRKDIRAAIALVLFKKAQKDDKTGNSTEAEAALQRAIELDPGTVYYLIALARMRHKSGNLPDAEKLLDQGLERFKDPQSQNELNAARDRLLQTEMFLKKIRKAGS